MISFLTNAETSGLKKDLDSYDFESVMQWPKTQEENVEYINLCNYILKNNFLDNCKTTMVQLRKWATEEIFQ